MSFFKYITKFSFIIADNLSFCSSHTAVRWTVSAGPLSRCFLKPLLHPQFTVVEQKYILRYIRLYSKNYNYSLNSFKLRKVIILLFQRHFQRRFRLVQLQLLMQTQVTPTAVRHPVRTGNRTFYNSIGARPSLHICVA